jgi:CDP-glycerol glycerophosphotransferase (TagB/SpsB family)
MKAFFIGLVLFFGLGTLYAADTFPPPFIAEYTLSARGIPVIGEGHIGKGTRTLTYLPNGQFEFKSFAKTTGLAAFIKKIRIEERTLFTRVDGKILPLEYSYHQTGSQSRSHTVSYDWDQGIAKNTYKGQTQVIPLEEGILDKLLYQIVLMEELMQGKRELEYKVVGKSKIALYRPTFIDWEFVETGEGSLSTLKYERKSENGKRRTLLWCAPRLHYLPVQVEHIEKDGEVFKMVLQSFISQ